MTNEVVQVGMEKLVLFFGTIISFLLTVITTVLFRYVNNNDTNIKEIRSDLADHETRISVMESDK